MSDTEKQVQQVLEAYKSAVRAKDVEAFMRMYDRDVRVFDTWGVWSYEGAASWRVAVEGWFTSLGAEGVRVAFEDVQIIAEKDSAFVSAIVTYTGVSAEGEELRAMQNRISWALKTRGHALRVFHEHTSAPVGFDDMKAMLHRKAK
jgi:ketosteroid isomerase-like protein